jgi:hypothetical protein
MSAAALLNGRLLAGVAIAASALAVLVAAAPPGPSPVVAVGQPSTSAAAVVRDDRDRALPACPGAAHVSPHLVSTRAGTAAERFVDAWAWGDRARLQSLADPVYRGRATILAVRPGGPGVGAELQVLGMGHDPLAGPIGQRCGAAALALMRIVAVRGASPPQSVVHVYVVWRSTGSRVWALR